MCRGRSEVSMPTSLAALQMHIMPAPAPHTLINLHILINWPQGPPHEHAPTWALVAINQLPSHASIALYLQDAMYFKASAAAR